MRFPLKFYHTRWDERGNRLYKTGTIFRERVFYPIWLFEMLLARHPHWDWLYNLSTGWGNPLCSAYCFAWWSFYSKRFIHEDYSVEVGYDNLSDEYKEFYEKDLGLKEDD